MIDLAEWVRLLVLLGTVGLAMALAATLAASQWWLFDLFSHFRWHYLAAGIALAALALWFGPRWAAIALAASVLPHLLALNGVRYAQLEAGAAPLSIRLVSANAHWDNRTPERLVDFIRASRPDVVVLQEGHPNLHPSIERLLADYPHVAPSEWRRSDVVILSRFPLTAAEPSSYDQAKLKYRIVSARIMMGEVPITVIGTHPPVPVSERRWRTQNEALADIGARARAAAGAIVVAGDFNLTPWSPRFRAFQREAGLALTRVGGVWPHTWPAASGWFYGGAIFRGLPIDHVLVGRRFAVIRVQRGPDIGSDHYPLIVDLGLPP